jgi:cell division protein FtsB
VNRRVIGVDTNHILILAALAIFLYLAANTAMKILQVYASNQAETAIEAEIERLKDQNKTLQAEKSIAESVYGIEKIIRANGHIKDGETGVIVNAEPVADSFADSSYAYQQEDTRPSWQLWWDFFFGASPRDGPSENPSSD